MCFNIHPKHKNRKTAKEDIVVYKRFIKEGKFLKSPWQNFMYEKGELYYEDSMKAERAYTGAVKERRVTIGLHSYSTLQQARLRRFIFEVLVKCIIPKGSKYYYNPKSEEYVSDHLLIGTDKDIIKNKKK